MLLFLFISASCRDSCFGNLQIGAAYFSIECEGNENTLQECAKTFARNCNLAVGIHCCMLNKLAHIFQWKPKLYPAL